MIRNPVVLASNGGHWKGSHDCEFATCGWVFVVQRTPPPRGCGRPHAGRVQGHPVRALPQATTGWKPNPTSLRKNQGGSQLLSLFVGHKLGTFIASENGDDLGALRHLIEAGDVKPVLDRTYPLNDTASAIRRLIQGEARGKIVITIPPPTGLTPLDRTTQRRPAARGRVLQQM